MCGLSHRHGWGCEINVAEGVRYFELAAKNSANIEEAALKQGSKAGGKAKGELAMALYELGNCHRHGWGMGKDPKMAFKYYQMAANMGDIESKNETAWCLENGFGTKKDKVCQLPLPSSVLHFSSFPAYLRMSLAQPAGVLEALRYLSFTQSRRSSTVTVLYFG